MSARYGNWCGPPARGLDEIPQPAAPRPASRESGAGPSRLETFTFVVVGVAALLFVCLGGVVTLGVGADTEVRGGEWAVVGSIWCVAVVLILPTVFLYRRRIALRRPR